MPGVLIGRGLFNRYTGRPPSETEADTGVMCPQAKRTPRVAGNHQKPGERPGPGPPEGAGPADTLTVDLRPPAL